jgi:hypothetical protein
MYFTGLSVLTFSRYVLIFNTESTLSPFAIPLYYVLWDYVQTVVCSSNPGSLLEINAKTGNAIHEISEQQIIFSMRISV